MDYAKLRAIIITAIYAEDALAERLVLKGGNALHLVHGLSSRSSLDLDLSMSDDFDDLEHAKLSLLQAVRRGLREHGLVPFDIHLTPKPGKPRDPPDPRWGGYVFSFKIATRQIYVAYENTLEDLRRRALVVNPGQRKIFKLDISKFEYCSEKEVKEYMDYDICVYSLPMIAAEKLRAICQQMPAYPKVLNKRARARDFYDIWVIESDNIDLAQYPNTLTNVFEAKDVPLALLLDVEEQREFHRADWQSVVDTVIGTIESFDFYFDTVLKLIERIEPVKHYNPRGK